MSAFQPRAAYFPGHAQGRADIAALDAAAVDDGVDADIKVLKDIIAASGLSVADLVSTAWASAVTYRDDRSGRTRTVTLVYPSAEDALKAIDPAITFPSVESLGPKVGSDSDCIGFSMSAPVELPRGDRHKISV